MLRVAEQAHKTDTGRQRNANEDSYFARAPVFVVADGMGGAQAGEVASSIAARAFEQEIDETESAEKALKEIVQKANTEIHELAEKDSSRAGMGTTLTTALVQGDEVSIAHVGDSRAYVFRDGELKQLTKDHSLVEELRRQGRLTDEQAEEHPQRSIITRALGPEAQVEVDTMTYPARDGDVFLLCSDGLTTMVDEEQIREILADSKNLKTAVGEAGRRRQRRRRPRQHHRGRLPARGRGAGRRRGRDPDRRHRRAGGPDGREGPRRGTPHAPRRRRSDAPRPPARRPGAVAAGSSARPVGAARARGARRRGGRRPLLLLPRHRRRRPRRPLPRPALRPAARHRPLRQAVLDRRPDGHALR